MGYMHCTLVVGVVVVKVVRARFRHPDPAVGAGSADVAVATHRIVGRVRVIVIEVLGSWTIPSKVSVIPWKIPSHLSHDFGEVG